MSKLRDVKVAISIPSTGTWVAGMARSLAMLISYFHTHRIPGVHKQHLVLQTIQGSMLASMRETLTLKALRDPTITHILWLDSDMEFPMNTLNRLLAHDVDFIAANCTTRVHPVVPTAHDLDGKVLDSRTVKGIQEVQHVGLAVTLIKTDAIKRACHRPMFLQDWIPERQAHCGEDVYFCTMLKANGVKLHVDNDLSVQIQHVGSYGYGFHDVEVPHE